MTFALKKLFIIFYFIFIFFNSFALSKNKDFIYSESNFSNYFSGIISINMNNTSQAFDFFKKAQPIQDEHLNYNIQFLRTLVLLEKFDESFSYLKKLDPENADFTEANLLLGINYFIKKDYLNAEKYFNKLKSRPENTYYLEDYLSNFLNTIVKLSQDKKSKSFELLNSIPENLNNLKKIQEAFVHCYLDSTSTFSFFQKLVNDEDKAFSRYNFFLVNYLVHKNNIDEAEKIILNAKESFDSNILILQSYELIKEKKYKEIKNFFNCKNPNDLMAEFFYVVANLYATENNYYLSNFYLKISFFLNKNFYSNYSLLAENYSYQGNFLEAKKKYFLLKRVGKIYSWYADKKIANIVSDTETKIKGINYLKKQIKKISKPKYYHYYDLGTFLQSNKNYLEAIKYYSLSLSQLSETNYLVPSILHRRGSSYERLKMWSKAEKDLKESLRLSPNEPYVLNYLAYSWLEKKINLGLSLEMLEKADKLKPNDGYIIDSLGWGHYLAENYSESEKFLRQAVKLMPTDPVINDHYGDVLWKLNKIIQARYFWNHALTLEKEDDAFIDNVGKKIIFGLVEKL